MLKTNINLSGKRRYWPKTENPKAYLQELLAAPAAAPHQHPPLPENPNCNNTHSHTSTAFVQGVAITRKLSQAPSQSLLTGNLGGGWVTLSLF